MKFPGEDETGYRAQRPVPTARIGTRRRAGRVRAGLPAPVVGIGPRTLPDAAELQVCCISEHETPPDYHARRYRVPPRGTPTLLGGLLSPGVSFAPGNITYRGRVMLFRPIGAENWHCQVEEFRA